MSRRKPKNISEGKNVLQWKANMLLYCEQNLIICYGCDQVHDQQLIHKKPILKILNLYLWMTTKYIGF